MSELRRWYCRCTGKAVELEYSPLLEEDDQGEPTCRFCGAGPSSDPRHTLTFKDRQDWDD